MALILETVLRDDLANAIDDSMNAGTSGFCELKFETTGDVEVATIIMQNPAFTAAATGVITMAGQPLQDTSATGNASAVEQFSMFDRTGTPVKQLEGNVETSGADINISSQIIGAGDTVELTMFTITVPA